MPGPIKLEDHSPAYKAYKNLRRPPLNLPPFTIDKHGQPKVRQRELVCRMPTGEGEICGNRSDSVARLWDHLQSAAHKIPQRLRPNLQKNVLSRVSANKLDKFFVKLMRHEEYSGKNANSGRRARKSAMGPPAPRPSCAPPSHDDDQDDEEPEVVKRENGDMDGRGVMDIDSSPVPEQRRTTSRLLEAETPTESTASAARTRQKRQRDDAVEIGSDDGEVYWMAQLKEKRAKRELKEAALEEAAFERKLAARKKR